MSGIAFISLLTVGAAALLSGLVFKIIRPHGSGEKNRAAENALFTIIEQISEKTRLSLLLKLLSNNRKAIRNRYLVRILELSEAGLSLQQLYLLKAACILTATALSVTIAYSNNVFQLRMLTETIPSSSSLSAPDKNSRYELYKWISNELNNIEPNQAKQRQQYDLIEKAVAERLETADPGTIKIVTEWFIKVKEEEAKLRVLKPEHISILILSFFIPDILLLGRWVIRGSLYKREIIKLEHIFELLARVDGIKTLDIILQLQASSGIYSKYIHEFALLFKYDKGRAFKYLKSRNIKSLSKLANIMEIYSLTDREVALQILEREVIERDEAILMTADETVDFIDLAAFLSITPLVYELARLMLNPMLEMVYKAIEYI